MQKTSLLLLAFLAAAPVITHSQSSPPKREFRGAWVATVINLDWPSSPFLSAQAQRTELVRILDELRADGINAVIFQVRSEADAMYASTLEPWSYHLTGNQGTAPSPFYDPLEFAIQEAHARGMELHAWFNPYRVSRQVGNYPNDPLHVSQQHPEWVLSVGTIKMLDPGLPQSRQHITAVVMDVVDRYDIDGVHFDDYFYPYPPSQISNQDAASFANYNRGITNLGDWRRDNVNLLIQAVYDSIQMVKPYVKFGISPFGIWKYGVPAGITGLDAYNDIYCDAVTWLQRKIIDYVTPQLYWRIGGGQDYGKLLPWWASQASARHLYVGQGVYRLDPVYGDWPLGEVKNQFSLNRENMGVQGSILFRAKYVRENTKGLADFLKTDSYRYPALSPVMAWKDSVAPNVPRNLRYERIAGTGTAGLQWDLPATAADGDSASRYVVYGFEQPIIQTGDLDDPGNIADLVGRRTSTPASGSLRYFVVTALDHNSNESPASEVLEVTPPETPVLAFPAPGVADQPPTVTLSWFYPQRAASYRLQVSTDSTFASGFLVNQTGLVDTFYVAADMEGQTTYYWHVSAGNPTGASVFSGTFRFTTGFPASPLLVYPTNNTPDIPINLSFSWNAVPGATSYHLQVSKSLAFEPMALVVDSAGMDTTAYAVAGLESKRFYFWRVSATNAIGTSRWPEAWRFKTIDATAVAGAPVVPEKFELSQNYPNPFNPVTTISFDLPKPGLAQLVIFDLLGRAVTTLVDEHRSAGHHEVQFDASPLPSGVYYYRLNFQDKILTRKMTVLK